MTLGVKVVDKLTNNVINENNDGLIFGVIMDDTISAIKEKIFISLGIKYYLNLLKLEIKKGDDYVVLDDNNCLLFYYDTFPKDPIVYVSQIFVVTDLDIYNQYDLQSYNLYRQIKEDNPLIKKYKTTF